MIDIDTLLALGAAYKKINPGDIIFNEGGECNFYHQLVSGTVRWSNFNEDGNEFIQNMIEPGECFGEMPLFDDEPFAATAIADTETVILRLHKSSFIQLLAERPDIHFAFTRMMSQRIRFKFLLLQELAHHDPEKSITTLLSYLKRTRKHVCENCNKVKLTRQQIANMTGLRVETVIRAIRQLHDKGSLVIEKGKVFC